MTATTPNSTDLKSVVWASILDLREDHVTPAHVNAVSNASKTILRITEFEFEVTGKAEAFTKALKGGAK